MVERNRHALDARHEEVACRQPRRLLPGGYRSPRHPTHITSPSRALYRTLWGGEQYMPGPTAAAAAAVFTGVSW
jgi:hypothetical protein